MIRAGDSIENPVTGERLAFFLGYEPVYIPAPAPVGAPAATAAA
jgi:hypothetical protein